MCARPLVSTNAYGAILRQAGGWLDENDTARAERWKKDIERRGNPNAWLTHYTRDGAADAYQVFRYIAESTKRIQRRARKRWLIIGVAFLVLAGISLVLWLQINS